jgi:FkbM family methyltransferase
MMINHFYVLRILNHPWIIKIGRILRARELANYALRKYPAFYVLSSGIKIRITSLEGWFLARELFSLEVYSGLKPYAKNITYFLDVGSNRAYFPIYLAHLKRLIGLSENELEGIGIEANPQLVEFSESIIESISFKKMKIIWGMVGCGAAGTGSFYLHPSDGLSSRFIEGKEIKVPCMKIEQKWQECFLDHPPDVLKIDIEGSEWDLLQTEGEFICKVGLVIIECHSPMAPFDKVTELMTSRGYKIIDVVSGMKNIHCAIYSRVKDC